MAAFHQKPPLAMVCFRPIPDVSGIRLLRPKLDSELVAESGGPATLLGVALLIVTAVHITGKSAETIADELSFGAALLFLGSCALSHAAISKSDDRFERLADRILHWANWRCSLES